MTAPVPGVELASDYVRFPVRTKDGHKTSVSIPRSLFEAFVKKCGGREDFRVYLNAACRQVEPVPGYSRSQCVRMYLEQQLGVRPQAIDEIFDK
ncbi:hypothetical protein CBM2592_A190036 [Cupriavidus taiwanensis]|nr:hypothetical protein CBM2592_A190036 [Cupriavidus taiwanensis]SOY83060.1 hypothetical protein CBM2591_A230038 [Cupriavidus taiwanensis]SOZ56259.1 hypothetical protein CBM2617_A200043 [Cupriavidus taiwanensis]SOZ78830.1 hypothetical protein CBM2618_A180045 [Cupriavidus taiwanensis]SOZ79106.1 hypothetical protein CBM2622_A170043 [Cupriavidus taiwanensis]